jgi:FO synthase
MKSRRSNVWREGIQIVPPAESERLLASLEAMSLDELISRACDLRYDGHGTSISYSRKVFIPLTRLCRDVCGYCTFAKAPRQVTRPYLTPEDVLAIAREGGMPRSPVHAG